MRKLKLPKLPDQPEMISIAGFALVAAAAWLIALPLGLAAAGTALLCISWMMDEEDED